MSRIILVGKAASGKDFLRDYLVKNYRLEQEVSLTTRPMREGEENGKSYHFVPNYVFKHLTHHDFFFECVSFNNWHYGTSMEDWCSKDVFIFTPGGIRQIPMPQRNQCCIVYLDIPAETRLQRLQDRSDVDSALRRVKADELDFKDFTDFDIKVTDPQFDLKRVSEHILETVRDSHNETAIL